MATSFDLTEPLPIEIKTTSLGTILIRPWKYGSSKKISEIISALDKSPRSFMETFVEKLGKIASKTAQDKEEAFNNGTPITNTTLLTDDDFEIIAGEYISSEMDKLLPHYSKKDDAKKNTDTLRIRADGETKVEHLIRLIRANIEHKKRETLAMFNKYSTSFTDKIREDLLKNNFALNSLRNQFDTITAIDIPPLPTFITESPFKETNRSLSLVYQQLEKMSSLTALQIEKAEVLNDNTTILVGESIKTGIQTKRSIFWAITTVIVSIIFSIISTAISLYSIISSNSDSKIYSSNLQRLIEVSQQNGSELSTLLKGLRETMERMAENGDVQHGNQQKVADDVSKALKLLENIEKQSNQAVSTKAQ